jgi:mannan polymerase II complex ANP1 subunit
MEEMEKERKDKEEKEKAERERLEKIKQQFDNPSSQWDKDKADIRDIAKKDYLEKEKQKEKEKEKAKQGAEDGSKKTDAKPKGPGEM